MPSIVVAVGSVARGPWSGPRGDMRGGNDESGLVPVATLCAHIARRYPQHRCCPLIRSSLLPVPGGRPGHYHIVKRATAIPRGRVTARVRPSRRSGTSGGASFQTRMMIACTSLDTDQGNGPVLAARRGRPVHEIDVSVPVGADGGLGPARGPSSRPVFFRTGSSARRAFGGCLGDKRR